MNYNIKERYLQEKLKKNLYFTIYSKIINHFLRPSINSYFKSLPRKDYHTTGKATFIVIYFISKNL